jgi:hypothetical protein
MARAIALRIAKEGLWGGDPERVLKAPADLVMDAAHYLQFLADYDAAYLEINKPNGNA